MIEETTTAQLSAQLFFFFACLLSGGKQLQGINAPTGQSVYKHQFKVSEKSHSVIFW